MYRKQGLATSLTNFVKGIAEAHGIGLYATCDVVRGWVSLDYVGLHFAIGIDDDLDIDHGLDRSRSR